MGSSEPVITTYHWHALSVNCLSYTTEGKIAGDEHSIENLVKKNGLQLNVTEPSGNRVSLVCSISDGFVARRVAAVSRCL